MSSQPAQGRQVYSGYRGSPNPTEHDRIVHLLDEYRASEAFVAEYLGAWIAASSDPRIVGGLRLLREREAAHARVFEARLRELGAEPAAAVPAERRASTLARYGATDISDLDKLGTLAVLFEDAEYFLQPVTDLIRAIRVDLHTRELLRTVLDDERASVAWLLGMHGTLAAEA
ncbi:MAG: hypothetical protein IT495_20270 [Gammaproteobacteria bacterium]|nr:hypothetical protein [Gammaproteobacteria bacterium]